MLSLLHNPRFWGPCFWQGPSLVDRVDLVEVAAVVVAVQLQLLLLLLHLLHLLFHQSLFQQVGKVQNRLCWLPLVERQHILQ